MNLREQRARLIAEAQTLNDLAEAEERDFTAEEQTEYDGLLSQVEALDVRIERQERLNALQADLNAGQDQPLHTRSQPTQTPSAPAFNRIRRGDSEARAIAHYIRTGDAGGLYEQRASNDTDMNIGTDADGGYAVPTGHYQGIIARRDEMMLTSTLGVRNIPGRGTTVNVPIDNEADGEFVLTTEANSTDRDAPALNVKAFTLGMYTKRVELSWQLLNDEDSRLLAFLEDFVARGMAKTHNNLLITEVGSNGTALKTYASATAIAAGEIEDIAFDNDLGNYLDDSGSVAWVLRSATFGDIASITGNARLYAETPGGSFARELIGYPAYFSNKVAATAASAKDVYFGNWNYVGYRESPGFTMIIDPYSKASTGQRVLHYFFQTVYGVLQAEAIGYGVHPSA